MRLPRRVDVGELRAAATAPPPARSSPAGWTTALVALSVAVGAALAVGWAWSAFTRPEPARQLAPGPSASVIRGSDHVAWADVLTELDARRSLAFGRGDLAALDEVYADGSAALAQERERLEQMQVAGVTARGLTHRILPARVLDTAPGQVTLAVRDEMTAHDLVTATGEVVSRRPARGEREWLGTVVPAALSEGEWRISGVESADN